MVRIMESSDDVELWRLHYIYIRDVGVLGNSSLQRPLVVFVFDNYIMRVYYYRMNCIYILSGTLLSTIYMYIYIYIYICFVGKSRPW